MSLRTWTTVATVTVLSSVSFPSFAATLTGSLSIAGAVDFEATSTGLGLPLSAILDFGSATVVEGLGSFGDIVGSAVEVTDLDFTKKLIGPFYEASLPVSGDTFIAFGTKTISGVTADLSFILSDPFPAFSFSNDNFSFGVGRFAGTFLFDGETLGEGALSFLELNDAGGFTISLGAVAVPEPLTFFASAMALGVGALFERKLKKSSDSQL